MSPEERKTYLETLRETPARLTAALKGVPRSLLLWRPAPGKWSILEIVCHMRDMERDAYIARWEKILSENNPTLPDRDGDRYALERGYRTERLADVLRDWKALRKQTLKLLKTIKGDAWSRPGVHETAGPMTAESLLQRLAVGNDAAHLGQIEGIKARFELLRRLESHVTALVARLRALSKDAVGQRTSDGKWSPLEVACHLRDCELLFAERFQKMSFSDRPALWLFDNDELAKHYRDADADAVLKDWKDLRGQNLILLRALPAAAWQRIGLHPKRGEVTVEQQAQMMADHTEGHITKLPGAH
jgi:hypothetical protein